MKTSSWILLGLFVLALVSRLLPHPANFSPLIAVALFAGREIKNRSLAFLFPFAVLFATDLILGLTWLNLFVYLGFFASVVFGRSFGLIGATLSSSLTFFVISNFGVWAVENHYPKTVAGLLECYTMALPFFHRSLLGDFFYVGVLFGLVSLIHWKKDWQRI